MTSHKQVRIKSNLVYFAGLFLLLLFTVSCNEDDDEDNNPIMTAPEVVTLPVTNSTESSAVTGGEVISDGGATVSARGVVWDTFTPSLNINMGLTVDGSGVGEFTSEITDLQLGETYYIRAYATNSVRTAYGETVLFTVVEGEVDNLQCNIVTSEGYLIEGEEANEVSFTIPYI